VSQKELATSLLRATELILAFLYEYRLNLFQFRDTSQFAFNIAKLSSQIASFNTFHRPHHFLTDFAKRMLTFTLLRNFNLLHLLGADL